MNTNPKNKPDEQFRRTAEQIVEQPKAAFDRATSANSDAAETMKDYYAGAVKNLQEYQNRLADFTQANVTRSLEFAQRLLSVRSPSEFFEVSSDHLRRQGEIMADQTKQLVELTQKVTLANAEHLKTGFESAFRRAA